jgi:hypothetical protein
MRRVSWLSTTVLFLLLAPGCGTHRTPSSPATDTGSSAVGVDPAFDEEITWFGRSPAGFFPLEIGNRWRYLSRVEFTTYPSVGSPTTYVDERDLVGEMICRETHDGRDYVVERRSLSAADGGSPLHYWIQHRQDRAGLYEWDDISTPPSCETLRAPLAAAAPQPRTTEWEEAAARLGVPASSVAWREAWEDLEARRLAVTWLTRGFGERRPGGVAPGEIQRLRYPLLPGQSWVIRDDPRFEMSVEGAVVLRTPAGRFRAWTIRIRSVLFDPRDVVRVWYGRAGYLGLRARTIGEATDPSGNVIGTIVSLQTETLTEISLVGRPLAAAPLGAPSSPAAD